MSRKQKAKILMFDKGSTIDIKSIDLHIYLDKLTFSGAFKISRIFYKDNRFSYHYNYQIL